jgi:hypothetical protein
MNPLSSQSPPSVRTIFLLSPAFCGGRRAQMLLRTEAAFPLAIQLRESGAPLGDVFQFMSGLYFRGKLAYARAFAAPPHAESVRVITPGLGLVSADRIVTFDDLEAIASVEVALEDQRYRLPLELDARALASTLDASDRVVLLGSIATGKYVDILETLLGERMRFPIEFVGRGDMSRGGLMLRCAADRRELEYVAVSGAVRHGPRPPKLQPLR